MRIKKLMAFTLASAMVLSMAGCGESKTTTEDNKATTGVSYKGTVEPDMVTVDLRVEPPEMNSLLTMDLASTNILREVMSGLYQLDPDDNPIPALAMDTQVSEDGRTYTMKLREDAKWSNGDPVTAHDFVFAYQKVCDKKTAAPYGFIVYENIVNGIDVFEGKKDPSELGVKALDDYTLEVTFNMPIPYAKHLFTFTTYLPMNQRAYEEIGADKYAKDADKIVTNGAYKMTEWVHDDHVLLEKNDDFYDADKIKIKKVKYLMMKDVNARMNAFKAGQVDGISLDGEQSKQLQAEGANVQSYVDNSSWYLIYNYKTKALSNPKIRQAFTVALDIDSLCNDVRRDGSVPSNGIIPTGIAGANGTKYRDNAGDIKNEYNVELANTLLEEGLQELGMKKEDLKISFVMDDQSMTQKDGAFIQEQWKKALGITVDIKPMPYKARIQSLVDGSFDIIYSGWNPDYNDPMTFLDMFMMTNANNYGHHENKKYDELVANAMKEVDVEKRQEMLIEAEKMLILEDFAIAPMYFRTQPYIFSDKMTGVTRSGFQEWDFTDGAEIVTK